MEINHIHKFYTSKQWRDLSYKLKMDRHGKCERCHKSILDFKYLIGHHKIELTEDNIHDVSITLNPELIEIICHTCHNKEHKRFGGHKKSIYIVYGSPLSGKTTLVNDLMEYGDIVMDMDAIWEALSFQDRYIKPDNLRFNIFKIRDELLDQIKMRYGDWYNAYIIGGYPDQYEREKLSKMLGAELIYCESTKEECVKRFEESNKPEAWLTYIDSWWDKFTAENKK